MKKMNDTATTRPPIIVPVGFGGKTTPYVPDPAPTLTIELPSAETLRELDRIEALRRTAQTEAAAIIDEAEAAAADLHRRSEEERQTVTSEMETLRGSLESERQTLDARAQELAEQERELESHRGDLEERLASADADIAEAGRVLAQARDEAEAILADARAAADELIDQSRAQAEAAAADLLAQARTAADAEVGQRMAEVESMHRIEIEVLTEREQELRARIAELESRLRSTPRSTPPTTNEDVTTVRIEPDNPTDDLIDSEPEDVRTGRHASPTDERGPRAITSHAPLTEQLSTSAFRTAEERKGKRRR